MFAMIAVYPGDDESDSRSMSIRFSKSAMRNVGRDDGQGMTSTAAWAYPRSWKAARSSNTMFLIPKLPENNVHVVLKAANRSRDAESMGREVWRDEGEVERR